MSRKIILIKQELLLLVYELNRSGLLAENEKIRPILADRKSGSAGMPRPISYAVFCLKKKNTHIAGRFRITVVGSEAGYARHATAHDVILQARASVPARQIH